MAGEATKPASVEHLEGVASPLLDLTDREFWTGLVVVVLSLISALATYLILTGLTPIAPRDEVVLAALFINVVLIAAMIAVIAWQGFGMWRAWRAKLAGARLHVRIVLLVLDHRRAARDAARGRRDDHVLALARQLVLDRAAAPSSPTRSTSRRPMSTSTASSSAPTSSTWSAISTRPPIRSSRIPRS